MKPNEAEAMVMFIKILEKAEKSEAIGKPISYALYQTWKYFDEHEKWRKK